MCMATTSERIIALASTHGLLRPRDVAAYNIHHSALSLAAREGHLEKLGRGLYAIANRSVSEYCPLAEAAKRVPKGVVCLLSALSFHHLTTQEPFEVWMAIDRKARKPQFDYPPLHLMWYSRNALEAGVEEHVIDGVPVRISCIEKTIADCFKYRNKIGVDVAVEALRDAWEEQRLSLTALWQYAKVNRVTNVIQPYCEALQ